MDKFAIQALGCKVNQYEEQVIRESLMSYGLKETTPENCDVFVVNSCTVTETADSKTRKLIRRVYRRNPGVKIFVTGCFTALERDRQKLTGMPEVFSVVPAAEKMNLPAYILALFGKGDADKPVPENITAFAGHTRAFLKVQDGCDQSCSYCKVTMVRGRSRSRDKGRILQEIAGLISNGYREIVLTGICLGAWKGANGEGLESLVESVSRLPGGIRIRLSSIEPNHMTDKLIEVVSRSKCLCGHFHIPLQSGSDRILSSMARRYDTEGFRDIIKKIRDIIPFAGISMDVISGFPGETKDDHERTKEFLRDMAPSRLHVFRYSDRPGTVANELGGKVDGAVAKKRVTELIGLGAILHREFCHRLLGREVEVMVEEDKSDGFVEGYSKEYVRVRAEDISSRKGEIFSAVPRGLDPVHPRLMVYPQDLC